MNEELNTKQKQFNGALNSTEKEWYIMSKYLLGTTTDKELVFGEFKVTTRNGYPEFTAYFDTVKPFKKDDIDAKEYYENLIDEMDDTRVS